MNSFDLIIIGGGPAGYRAAERAGEAGLTVALFEKSKLGGVCLNEGCIPTKTLLYSAKIYDEACHSEAFGITADRVSIDHAVVVRRKNKIVRKLTAGVSMQLKESNVTVLNGRAEVSRKTAEGFEISAGGEHYYGRKLLIATGSQPVIPPIPGLKEGLAGGFATTSREILDRMELPKSLIVIGGGIIGLEMASYFNSAGVQVTVIEMLDKIAGPTDREISEILMRNYEKKGISFKLKCRVKEIQSDSVVYEDESGDQRLTADAVLLSIGRRPDTEGLGLERIGVRCEKGSILTDQYLKTNIEGVFAAGDVNGKSMLAHTAYREAEAAVNNMLGRPDPMHYSAVPSVIYTNPEVASVGETEDTAREKGLNFKVVKLSMNYSGRYAAEHEAGDGICKLVVDQDRSILLGVQLICSYASEIIYGAALMIEEELDMDRLKRLIFPHPTNGEIIREGLFRSSAN